MITIAMTHNELTQPVEPEEFNVSINTGMANMNINATTPTINLFSKDIFYYLSNTVYTKNIMNTANVDIMTTFFCIPINIGVVIMNPKATTNMSI